ncbi:PLP-dependent aminotransferase family protein [Paenibacillus sp. S150]|uniref:aminotransferase-like domain-containing protein n=1 Tax=Paenibacillus sp. S150 TaxID=2749826 RepID=UPI001C598956|nr:PLP-dependent aminotransferase family protein [Paenibacillus sp. S150]MBW4082302.1 PLP-dependent aminotransferase family protein [Paenibacillus sp. S150]
MPESFTYNRFLQTTNTVGGTKNDNPDHVHLSFGFPYSELFPVQALAEAAKQATLEQGTRALHYFGGPAVSFLPSWVGGRLEKIGMQVPVEQIKITVGAAQAIEVIARILCNVGDEVWVENPSFFGAVRMFRLAGAARIRSFEIDSNGILIEPLQVELERRVLAGEPLPKLLYVMPNYQNPTGVCLSVERRQQLADLAARYGFYILEDDAYLELNFNGSFLPAIHTFAPRYVIHIGTFSKIIGPGVRLGWAVVPPVLSRFVQQFMSGSQTNPYMQEIVSTYLQNNDFQTYLDGVNAHYREQRDVMVNALVNTFGDRIEVQVPRGGFFLCARFTQPTDVIRLTRLAEAHGVSVLDGSAFYENKEGRDTIRLCFTYCSGERIALGIRRLYKAYQELQQRPE